MKKSVSLALRVFLVACAAPAPGAPAQRQPSVAASTQTPAPTLPAASPGTTGTPAFLSGIPVVGVTAGPLPTFTTAPVLTSTSTAYPFVAVWFSVDQNVNCRVGPNPFYNVVHVLKVGEQLAIKGRTDATLHWAPEVWLQIQLPASPALCWVTTRAGRADGNIDLLPVAGYPTLPDPPLNFRVSSVCPEKGHTRTVKLSWTGMKGVTGYALYRQEDYADKQLLATLPADVTSFKDELRLNNFYTYELASTDENGTSGHVDAWVAICK